MSESNLHERESLNVELFGLELSSPLILASGVLGTTPGGLNSAIENGAGAVTTKSLGLQPREGHRSPNMVEVDCGYLNAMGLPNPGVEYFANELKAANLGAPVFGSIYGEDPSEFEKAAAILSPVVDGIELNLSCPHASRVGSAVGADPRMVEEITSAVCGTTEVPVLAKLTPNTSRLTEIGQAAQAGGASGVVAVNTVSGMVIDVKARTPILGNETGGLSGEAIHPVAVKAVFDLYETLSIPIIGVGGVSSAESAIELMLAGASGVQIGTGIATHGLSVFHHVNMGLRGYLRSEDLSLNELVGLAHSTG